MEHRLLVKEEPWSHPQHFDAGIDQIVLIDSLDEVGKKGRRTRIVRFRPGAQTIVPFVHDYHEEVYLLEGDQMLVCEGDSPITGESNTSVAGTYFRRPAGTYHGPFRSENGCLLLEIHYY